MATVVLLKKSLARRFKMNAEKVRLDCFWFTEEKNLTVFFLMLTKILASKY